MNNFLYTTMDVDQLMYVLQTIINGFVYPMDPLTFINSEPKQILGFGDFMNLSMVCRALRDFTQTVQYMHYKITCLDYGVDLLVQKHGAAFLYCAKNPVVVRRFLEIFGYTYSGLNRFNVLRYYPDQTNPPEDHLITPLHYMCKKDRSDIAKVIIDYNSQTLSRADYIGDTPILNIWRKGNEEFFIYVVTNYPKYINEPCRGDGSTMLLIALRHGLPKHKKLLIDVGGDPNLPAHDPPIFTAMHCTGDLKILFKSKIPVNLNAVSKKGLTISEHLERSRKFPYTDSYCDEIAQIICEYAATRNTKN
jgi:hypothetical protein